jgi:hypothetical protein
LYIVTIRSSTSSGSSSFPTTLPIEITSLTTGETYQFDEVNKVRELLWT